MKNKSRLSWPFKDKCFLLSVNKEVTGTRGILCGDSGGGFIPPPFKSLLTFKVCTQDNTEDSINMMLKKELGSAPTKWNIRSKMLLALESLYDQRPILLNASMEKIIGSLETILRHIFPQKVTIYNWKGLALNVAKCDLLSSTKTTFFSSTAFSFMAIAGRCYISKVGG